GERQMNADEARQSIAGWCTADDNLEYTGEQSEDGADYAGGVRVTGTSGAPVELQVLHTGGDRITLRHTASIASSSAESAQKVFDQRPGWLLGRIDRSANGTSAVVETHVYLDGLSKNSFVQAAAEVAHTARLVGGVTTTAAAATPAVQPSYTPAMPQGMPSAQPMGAPTFSPQPQQQQYQPAPQQQPAAGPGPWVPTHSVPPQGLRAWAAPDPAGPVVANLAPGLPIQVAEVRGAWARVICSNGWVGWIDGRLIGVAA
ncbi:MAG TPA: SH3 domain-containing protein, partial [Candidatus Dormibacteraeota bacterium]|nr:SH3 domain-containing protein [Candidatus Dormibacteraeota bacterium]